MAALFSGTRFRRRLAAPRHGPAARLAVQSAAADDGLRFSDWMLIGVLALAYLLSISQPVFGIQLHLTILNHFPLVLLLPVMAFQLVSLAFYPRPPARHAIVATCWPLILLALYALVGSLVARFHLKVGDSYLSFAFYLLLLPLWAAVAPSDPARVAAWARTLIRVWLLVSLAALAGELARVNTGESLHEIEYLVISGFFIVLSISRSTAVKVLLLVLLMTAAVINQKLTGYIIAALAVLHVVFVSGWYRQFALRKSSAVVLGTVAFVIVGLTLAALYFSYRDYLPSGNAEVRLKQYDAAWRQFVASPVWGNAYLKGSGEDYVEASRILSLPTHSDVLDMLKHGGAIALLLFVWGYWKIFALLNRAIDATRDQRLLNGYFIGVRFFQVTALVTFCINPLLLKGSFLIVIWGNLGLAVGLALAVVRDIRAPRPT